MGRSGRVHHDESLVIHLFTVAGPLAYPDWLGPDRLNIYYRVAVAF